MSPTELNDVWLTWKAWKGPEHCERNMESKNERKQAENQKDVEKEWNAEKDGEQPGESENLRRQREVKQAENVKRGMKWKWRTWHSSADSRAESFLL